MTQTQAPTDQTGPALDQTAPLTVVAVSAGTSESSTTTGLARDMLVAVARAAERSGLSASTQMLELKPLAHDIASAITTGLRSENLRAALETLGAADAVIIATPIYKASYSGLLKSFLDVADDDTLTATPVAMVATAGTPRHALAPDVVMRPLLSYMRALVIPTPVFAATEDWASPAALNERLDRAAAELVALASNGSRQRLLAAAGGSYSRTFDGSSATAAHGEDSTDFSSELMRLATGGSATH